jgi:hypothetical protein
MRFHRYALEGAVNSFLVLRTNGPLVLGDEEALAFNELDSATREDVHDIILDGPATVCTRIREAIAQ